MKFARTKRRSTLYHERRCIWFCCFSSAFVSITMKEETFPPIPNHVFHQIRVSPWIHNHKTKVPDVSSERLQFSYFTIQVYLTLITCPPWTFFHPKRVRCPFYKDVCLRENLVTVKLRMNGRNQTWSPSWKKCSLRGRSLYLYSM